VIAKRELIASSLPAALADSGFVHDASPYQK
jgi:hypothetical protein